MFEEVRLADRLGYAHVWTTEQHGVEDGYLPAQLPVLAAYARETTRIRLGSGVILLPLTQWRRVAEEAGVVDVLSGGRLTLGVGAGNYPHEFRAFGVRRDRRGALLEEGIRFLKPGLAGDVLPDGLPVNVPPLQRPLPLVVGGLAERAVDRAVRLGDGHFGYAYLDPERELPRLWEDRLRPALERHGRSSAGFRRIVTTIVWTSERWEREWREVVGPAFVYQQQKYLEWEEHAPTAGGYVDSSDLDPRSIVARVLVGPPDEVVDRLVELHAAFPFEELVLWHRLPGVPHRMAMDFIERFAGEILPAVNTRRGGATVTGTEGGT